MGVEDDEQLSKCNKCYYYCRSVAAFIFSHIGLFSMVVGYTIMGAYAFKELEVAEEQNINEGMRAARENVTESLWQITYYDEKVLHYDNWTTSANKALKEFEKTLVSAVRAKGYDGTEEPQWTFSGALLYSIIVITTIGYGNMAPKTKMGKVVTILYAVVGIPLLLLCMSNIGDTMAQAFKFVYWKVCCYFCIQSKRSRRSTRSVRYHRYPSTRSHQGSRQLSSHHSSTRSGTQGDDEGSGGGGSYYGSSTADDKYVDDDMDPPYDHRRKLHHHQSSSQPLPPPSPPPHSPPVPPPLPSTPGQVQQRLTSGYEGGGGGGGGGGLANPPEQVQRDADKVPIILNKYVLESKEDLRVDLPPSPHKDGYSNHLRQTPTAPSMGPTSEGGSQRIPNHPLMLLRRTMSSEPLRHHSSSRRRQFRHNDDFKYVDSDDDVIDMHQKQQQELEKEEVTVPIWLCCALVTGYIGGGGFLFQYWEGWTFFASAYFCFVTLTTIGFGDLVPGKKVIHDDNQTPLIICALYLLFGMALLAMSFNLVQEQVTTTVKSIGKMIGIVEDEDVDDDDD